MSRGDEGAEYGSSAGHVKRQTYKNNKKRFDHRKSRPTRRPTKAKDPSLPKTQV